MHLDSKFEID